MKKRYIQPALEIVDLDMESLIFDGSILGNKTDGNLNYINTVGEETSESEIDFNAGSYRNTLWGN